MWQSNAAAYISYHKIQPKQMDERGNISLMLNFPTKTDNRTNSVPVKTERQMIPAELTLIQIDAFH